MRNIINLIFLSLCLSFNIAQAAQSLDSIAAVVNDEIITTAQLNQRVAMAKQQLRQQHIALPANKVMQQQVLDMMISQTLQLQIAKRANITVSDAELQQAISETAARNNMNSAQLFNALQKEGVNKTAYLQQVREQMVMSKLQRELVASHISVRPAEIDAYLRTIKAHSGDTQYHLQDILITLPESPTPDQIAASTARAQKLITKLRAGADFKSLAAAESNGQQALQGGDLGWRTLAELPATFSSIVKKLQVGEVSSPIRSDNGLHILMLTGVRAAQQAATADQVSQMLFKRKFDERLYIWMQQLRDTAYVKILLPQ